jgi:hypothetical protein
MRRSRLAGGATNGLNVAPTPSAAVRSRSPPSEAAWPVPLLVVMEQRLPARHLLTHRGGEAEPVAIFDMVHEIARDVLATYRRRAAVHSQVE